ncbi:MAG: PEP-CTERM sorting domain-containing protein [Planctomycetota bacterium]
MGRTITGFAILVGVLGLAESTHAELITIDGPGLAGPNTTVSLLVRLSDNNDPLIGYSLNVDVAPEPGAVGGLRPNVALSNFFPEKNLITRGGGFLHPVFSLIQESRDAGLFINAQELRLRPVTTASPGINDVLAQLVFDVLPGSNGLFTIGFGPFTVLVDGAFDAVPFNAATFQLFVPEPMTALLILAGAIPMICFRRHKRDGRNHSD